MQEASTGIPAKASYTNISQQNGIRQRSLSNGDPISQRPRPTLEEAPPSSLSAFRGTLLIVSTLGVLSFSVLALLFGSRYAFFGFHGNMEEATASCWQTASLFAVIALFAAFPSVKNALTAWRRAAFLRRKQVLPLSHKR